MCGEVTESYSAFDFVREAKTAIEEITARGKLPIIAGGTGLYIQSLLEGYHLGGEVPHEEILAYRAQLDVLSDEDLYQRVAEQGLVILSSIAVGPCGLLKLRILGRTSQTKRPIMNPISSV